jgi:hypothetical protein
MANTFAAAVKDWAQKTEEKQTAVAHQSLRLLDQEVAATVTVKTGNLRNSRQISTSGNVTIDWTTKKFRDPTDAINGAIAGVEMGRTASYGFRAPYAFKIEKVHGFFRLAAQRWSEFVDTAARMVK